METHIPFPKIRHFKDFIYEIQYNNKNRQLIPITGTIKLHGSHADIVAINNEFYCQSRNRIITKDIDNHGFANFIDERKEIIEKLITDIKLKTNSTSSDIIFINGEICGSNIQKNIALIQLPKMFVIFNIKINDKWIQDLSIFNIDDDNNKIYSILRAPTYNFIIDTDYLVDAQKFLDKITTDIDKCCPFAKTFDVDGIGEGLVWKCTNPDFNSSRYWFKTKGPTHTENIKIKDKLSGDDIKKTNDFAYSVLTESRCNKGLDYLKENNIEIIISNIKYFVKYLCEDILDECKKEIIENDISFDKLKTSLSKKSCVWYKNYLNSIDSLIDK